MVLGIYGAGGLGRELLILAKQINDLNRRWNDIVFIDDGKTEVTVKGTKVYSYQEAKSLYIRKSDIEFIVAVGEPAVRKAIREKLDTDGYCLAVLVHPTVSIPECTKIGEGTVICYNSFISCDNKIGKNVLIQPSACVGHDNSIGNDAVISSGVCLAGGCSVGNETYIGMGVPVREKTIIGSQSIIGMGSVVLKSIPDHVIALGNPARPMRENIEKRVFS